jgi:hypothetical protein
VCRPTLGGGGARRSSPSPLPSGCRRVVLVRPARIHMNETQPATIELSATAHVARVCFKCFRCFKGMLQVFYIDVEKN